MTSVIVLIMSVFQENYLLIYIKGLLISLHNAYFLKLQMYVYLSTKFQICSTIPTSFKDSRVILPQNEPLKSAP